MALLIDTSVLVAIERSNQEDTGRLGEAVKQSAYLAAISASELLHGVHRSDSAVRRARRAAFVEEVLRLLPVLDFDLAVARLHARLWADLVQRGRLIGAHDLQIAATALAHDLTLLTTNERDFRKVEGLRVQAWGDAPPPAEKRRRRS